MIGAYDIAWAVLGILTAPVWLVRSSTRRKVLLALRQRMGDVPQRTSSGPAILIHAVSLGEINATRALVEKLQAQRPQLAFIISTTTQTGFDRAQTLYGQSPGITLIRYPLDFTPAVRRVLDRVRPALVVLMELEVWPNFIRHCCKRGIPVIVINARLTTKSYRNYQLAGLLARRMFARLGLVCAQDQTYANRFINIGVPRSRVRVTGTMKFDTAPISATVEGADDLAAETGLSPGKEPILVCGSTGPGEEEILLDVYQQLLGSHAGLRLVIVPRKPERFEEVAKLIASRHRLLRRSENKAPDPLSRPLSARTVVLGDTMGELRKFYSLADIVFVGRTLVDLGPSQHGSDMIEPAALARPVIIGPFTDNFAEAMKAFTAAGAMRRVRGADDLPGAVEALLNDPVAAQEMGQRAQQVVRENQGATDRHVEVILRTLDSKQRDCT